MHKWPAQRDIRTSPLVTRAELLATGVSRSAISRRVQRGALVIRHPGVYSYAPGNLSPEARWLAATLACSGVLGELSAAALYEVSRWPDETPHVLVARRHQPVEGIVIHHCLGLDRRDVTIARGIPVTTTARMFLDLGTALTPHQLAWVINEAAFRRRFNLQATLQAAARAAGHPGRGVLARALELYAAGSAGTKSRYEDAFLELVAVEPLVNTELHGYEVDFHWPDRKLVVEVDGNHTRPKDARNDAARDRTLRAAGYTVVRFTGAQVEQRPGEVLSRLAPLLPATRAPGAPVPLRSR